MTSGGEPAQDMVAEEILKAVATLHGQLVVILGELDRLGRTVAAAHLIGAVDVLEAELDGRHALPFANETDQGVAALARAMTESFGDRAEEVARRQLADADGIARLAWAAIVQAIADQTD